VAITFGFMSQRWQTFKMKCLMQIVETVAVQTAGEQLPAHAPMLSMFANDRIIYEMHSEMPLQAATD